MIRASFLFLFAVSISAFATDLPYKDGDFGCTSRADADRYVADFSVDVESFGGMALCDGTKDTKKLLNDLSLIEHAEFNADAQHNLIRGFVPFDNYYGWMKGETRGMQRGNDIPFATAYNQGGYFTMQDGWSALSSLGRVGTVIHEARHTEGYPHYACTHGPYAGSQTAGCDTSYSQNGAHAVEMEYYARVTLDAKNLHPVYQSMARLMALGRANFVFNDSPIQPREALLARAGDRLVLLEGRNAYERKTPPGTSSAVLKRTSFGASLVSGRESVAVDLYDATAHEASINDDYSYYKLFRTPRQGEPRNFTAVEELDQGGRRYFAVLGDGNAIYSYDFPKGAWSRSSDALEGAQTLVTRAPSGIAGLFAVQADGTMVPFDFAAKRFGAPLRDRWTSDARAYALNGSQLVKLTADGRVVDAKSGAAVDGFQNQSFSDLVNVPLYDAFQVAR